MTSGTRGRCFEAGRWEQDHGGDVQKAAEKFGRACALGDAAGCSAQVDLILSGTVTGTSRTRSTRSTWPARPRQSIAACARSRSR